MSGVNFFSSFFSWIKTQAEFEVGNTDYDIIRYSSPAPNDRLDGKELNSEAPSTSSQFCVEKELELSLRKHQTIARVIKKRLPIVHGSMEAPKLANRVKKKLNSKFKFKMK